MTAHHFAFAAICLAATLLSPAAHAVNCEVHRDAYPTADWKSLDGETPLYVCSGPQVQFRILLTPLGETAAMLTVATDQAVFRKVVDARDIGRIKNLAGQYSLNTETSCAIRGSTLAPAVLSFSDFQIGSAYSFLYTGGNTPDFFYRCEKPK